MPDFEHDYVMNIRWPENEALRAERMARGWSYAQEALELKALGKRLQGSSEPQIDATTCWRWEAGVQRPAPYYRRLLCLLYGKSANELGLAPVKRRQFLRLGVAVGAHSVDFLARREATAIDAPSLGDLRRMTRNYARELSGVPLWHMESTIQGHLAFLKQLLSIRPHQLDAREVGLAVAEAAVLTGWLSYFMEQRVDAQMYWSFSDRLSEEVEDGPLRAYALTSLASLYSGPSQGRPAINSKMAIALLDEAERCVGLSSSPYLRAYVWARRAEEHATNHDHRNSSRDLDRAEKAIQEARDPDQGFFSDWSQARLAGYRGNCAVLLGRPAEAAAILEKALEETAIELVPQRAGMLADLGSTYAQPTLLDIDHSCALLSESLRMSNKMGVVERVQRVVGVRERYLEPWRTAQAVKRLDEELAAVVAARQP